MREPQEYPSDGTPLITAAQLGKLRLARLLVEGGAQVNERNQKGETPLLAACKALRGHQGSAGGALRLLQYLLENGADPNAQDKAGRTALMYACMEKAGPAVAAALIGAGADPSMEDYAGASALVYAVNAREQETLQTLLDACRRRGRDIIIIATDLSADGDSRTRRYLNVPPSPDTSPVACMSPSEIELRAGGSPGSEAEGGEHLRLQGRGRGKRAGPRRAGTGTGRDAHPTATGCAPSPGWPFTTWRTCAAPTRRDSGRRPGPGPSQTDPGWAKRGRTSRKALSPSEGPLPHLSRRNTLPCLQDAPLLQLPCLNPDHCGSDPHLQPPLSGWSPAPADGKRKGSQLRTSFLPPLPSGSAAPPGCPAAPAAGEMPPRPPRAMPRLGSRWGRRLQRRHSIQLDQIEPAGQMGSSEEILIL
ncbi:hypothetical protein AAFF_G00307240 [Aldrovandia affinis]|uniref:Ankyrin repeat domain-containing protein 34A n=1 Tax=Aldrovandia affinis TaxID=143900 RepID=A0AAD7RAJ9_9TELE|nr:hypothetical protein AAFF_G00307240 [Aldrovandia affinis]